MVSSTVGRPVKAGVVREELYDWFCLLKRSVQGRIPAAFVLQKACTLVEDYVLEYARREGQANAPVISHSWLRSWRLSYGISFRKPNRKWKVARHVLAERLRITWENTCRVRALALEVLGYDLDLDNLDQSPFHMNEAGSQAQKSLCIRGGGVVPLKEGHAQTRERWTLQTTTTSNAQRARNIPPVEVMFKADGELIRTRLQPSIPAWAPWLTVVTSPKASYREDDVLDFIENRLEDMTPGRRWRVLLLDAYSAHLTDRVRRCAWHKGYVVITHGGGASAVTQTNDTDLHAHLKRFYLELEMAAAAEQMRLLPKGVPCPRREDVIGWVACIWCNEDLHMRAGRAFQKVGLSNSLDGREDGEICREAGSFWRDGGPSGADNMHRLRQEAVHDVREECRQGRLQWTFAHVYRLINPFPRRGKGQDEEPMDLGSDSSEPSGPEGGDFDDDDQPALPEHSDSDSDRTITTTEPGDDSDSPAVAGPCTASAEPGAAVALAPADTSCASSAVAESSSTSETQYQLHVCEANLQSMQVVLEQVQTIGHLSLEAQIRKAIHVENRKVRILCRERPEVTEGFFLAQDADRTRLRREQASIRRAVTDDKQRRVSIKELAAQEDNLRKRKLELLQASTVVECQQAVKSWDTSDLGQGHTAGGTKLHAQNRRAILERLRGRGKPLPPDLANDWVWFLRQWDQARLSRMQPWRRGAWGSVFRDMVQDLMKEIQTVPDVFAKWMRSQHKSVMMVPALRL